VRGLASRPGHVKTERFQVHLQIHVFDPHVGGKGQSRRREVEQRLQAGRRAPLGDFLRGRGGDRDDADLDRPALHDLAQAADVLNDQAAPGAPADLLGVAVEERRKTKALRGETAGVRERLPEVSGPDDRESPRLIEAENRQEVALERGDVVADAADAELAEGRQVLADLRRAQVEAPSEALGGDMRGAFCLQVREAAQIEGQPRRRQLRDGAAGDAGP
jgi:hypothetical protein